MAATAAVEGPAETELIALTSDISQAERIAEPVPAHGSQLCLPFGGVPNVFILSCAERLS